MWQLEKAPCPPPGVYAHVLFEIAQNNGLSQNITEQIRRRCNVSHAPTTTTTTTTTTTSRSTTIISPPFTTDVTTSFAISREETTVDVGLIVGIVLGVAAFLVVVVAVAVYLYRR